MSSLEGEPARIAVAPEGEPVRIAVAPEAELALKILEDSGHEAYLVGGCVRDWLMGIPPGDYDIAAAAMPEETREVFTNRGYSVIETGMRHGTVTVLIHSIPLEITTYRVDGVYSDHRRPDDVTFTARIEEDLARRDFTVNALAWSSVRGLVDIYGGGEDLSRGILRCVGEPEKRFREDALRIFRALRFSARFGFGLEERTRKAVFSERELLREVSAERIYNELKKLLAGKHAAETLIKYGAVLGVAVPEILPMVGFEQNNPHHSFNVWDHSAVVLSSLNEALGQQNECGIRSGSCDHLRLAALLHDVGKPECYSEDEKGIGHFYGHAKKGREIADTILSRLKADTFTRERVDLLIQYHDTVIQGEKRGVKRWMARLGTEAFYELMMLKQADNMGQNREQFDRQPQYRQILRLADEILENGDCFSLGDLAVNGRDLMETGVGEGPEIGRRLQFLLAAVMDGEVENDREKLLRFLDRNL